jgi:uncharacterized membrane protein HdeD (DUF308 family)
MIGLTAVAKAGGSRMRIFGVIAIILGILCLLTPWLTGLSALTLMGLLVWAIGILLGIKLFFMGLVMVMGGSAVRSIANRLGNFAGGKNE